MIDHDGYRPNVGILIIDRSGQPEFDGWRWVDYWYPIRQVVPFKRQVYERALRELAPLLFPERAPRPPGV